MSSLWQVCSQYIRLIFKDDNFVYSWGENSRYALGVGNDTSLKFETPQLVYNEGTEITQLVCGSAHNLLYSSPTSIIGSGENTKAQLGSGSTTNIPTFQSITNLQNKNFQKLFSFGDVGFALDSKLTKKNILIN